jgi:hypothetical protein
MLSEEYITQSYSPDIGKQNENDIRNGMQVFRKISKQNDELQ